MVKFKAKRYFGLDIGDSAIKLVEIKKTRDGFRLSKARLVELNIDPIFDSGERRNSVIKESLKQLFAEEGINSGIVALSISGQSVFIRQLKIPKIAKSKIEQIIHYEAQLQVPFPINEVIWNYEIFDIHDSPETEVALIAVKKDIVEERLKFLSDTELEVDFVEVDPFSLFNVLNFVDGLKNKIILDIGAKITDIIIAEERKLWVRSILIGGNDLTRAIAANLKISFKEAEELKRREGIVVLTEEDKDYSPHSTGISDAITPVLVELLTDISKSIGYYKSQFGETRLFKEILITGGCSKLRNIARFIRENIDIPTDVFNVFEKIKGDLDFTLTENLIGRMDVGVGLALRTVTPLTTKANLLPKRILQTREFEKKKWYILGSLLILICVSIMLNGFVSWLNIRKSATLAKTSALIKNYDEFHREITSLQAEINNLKTCLEFVVKLSKERKETIEFFTELTSLLPDNIWLIEISQDKAIFALKGNVKGTFEDISKFKDTLLKSGYFKDVRIESADVLKEKEEDITEDIRAFTIKIEMPGLEGANHGT